MSFLVSTPLSLLTTSSTINIIYASVENIYYITSSLVSGSKTVNIEVVLEFLERTSLQSNLEIYTALMKEINNYDSNAMNICFENTKKIIQSIELELIDVNNKRIYNNSLFYGFGWLSYSFQSNVNRLELLKSRLDDSIRTLKTVYLMVSRK